MTAKQRIEKLRGEREDLADAINKLLAVENRTAEQTGELETAQKRHQEAGLELRAAKAAAETEGERIVETREVEVQDGETRARLELRAKARVTEFMRAFAQGRFPQGAELELQQAAGCNSNGIPMELFDYQPNRRQMETRADAPTQAPATGRGSTLDSIRPMIFARAVLPRLGVAIPRVPSGGYATATITTGLTAGAKGPGAVTESTAATITPASTTPHRVSGRESIRIEDIALVGTDNYESAIRQNMMLTMSAELDRLGLRGDPSSNADEPQGLIGQLTDPDDPTAVVDWAGFVAALANGIDGGPWAETMTEVKLLVNAETMRLAERTFQAGSGTDTPGEMSAAAYLRQHSGGFMASSRMPATAATIAPAIRVRMATMGLDAVDAVRLATCPVWAEVTVDDISVAVRPAPGT